MVVQLKVALLSLFLTYVSITKSCASIDTLVGCIAIAAKMSMVCRHEFRAVGQVKIAAQAAMKLLQAFKPGASPPRAILEGLSIRNPAVDLRQLACHAADPGFLQNCLS
jgi:hypothetical protein